MRTETFYGIALIGSSVALLATGLSHPTGGQLLASREAFDHMALVNTIAHSLGMLGAWLALFGVIGLSRKLGLERVGVTAALAAFALASMAVIIAAVIDGLALPALLGNYFDIDDAGRTESRRLMQFGYLIASSLTRFYMVAVAVAILLWSWAMVKTEFNRALSWVGAVVACLGLVALVRDGTHISVHELLAVVAGQSVWMVWAGVVMIRGAASANR